MFVIDVAGASVAFALLEAARARFGADALGVWPRVTCEALANAAVVGGARAALRGRARDDDDTARWRARAARAVDAHDDQQPARLRERNRGT